MPWGEGTHRKVIGMIIDQEKVFIEGAELWSGEGRLLNDLRLSLNSDWPYLTNGE